MLEEREEARNFLVEDFDDRALSELVAFFAVVLALLPASPSSLRFIALLSS